MLQYDELRLEFEGLKPRLKELAQALDLEKLKSTVAELEEQAAQPGFWDDTEKSQKILQKTV